MRNRMQHWMRENNLKVAVDSESIGLLHYSDVIMGAIVSQITSLTIF